MSYPKYRIKSQTEEQYMFDYKPQVKYSLFGFWQSVGKRVGYQTLEEVLGVIERHREILKQVEKINEEGI